LANSTLSNIKFDVVMLYSETSLTSQYVNAFTTVLLSFAGEVATHRLYIRNTNKHTSLVYFISTHFRFTSLLSVSAYQ